MEKHPTIPKHKDSLHQRGQNNVDLPDRVPPAKQGVTRMLQTKVESAVSSKGNISCKDTFFSKTWNKIWIPWLHVCLCCTEIKVCSQNNKIFKSGVQTALELLLQIHIESLSKKSTPLQTLPFIMSPNSHQMSVWNLTTLMSVLMYTQTLKLH